MTLEPSKVRVVELEPLEWPYDVREGALVRYIAERLKAGYSFVVARRAKPGDLVLEVDRAPDGTYRVAAWRENGTTAGTKSLTKQQVEFMVRAAVRNALPVHRQPPIATNHEEALTAALRTGLQEDAPTKGATEP